MAQESAALGSSTTANATYTVAGAPFDDIGAQDSGVVKVFDTVTGELLHVLVNPTPAAYDYFGYSVALTGSKLVVGAYLDDTDASNAGIAYVYDLAGSNPTLPLHVLRNPSAAASDHFGFAVAASGQRIAVAAPLKDQAAANTGTVYIYKLDSASPADPVQTLHNPSPVSADQFGHAIALDGAYLLAGVPQKDQGATNAGSVELFHLTGATPAIPVVSLPNPHPAATDQFGNAVAIHGQRFVVGVFMDDASATNSGRAYVYDFSAGYPSSPYLTLENPSPAANDQFGYAVAMSGSHVVVSAPYDDTAVKDAGQAYLYNLGGAQPAQPVVTLSRPSPATDDQLGWALAMHGDCVVAGIPSADTDATNSGALALFNLASGVPTALMHHPSPSSGDFFGGAVAISGTHMVIGARLNDSGASNAGSVFVYNLAGASPAATFLVLHNPNPFPGDEFGQSVAISGSRIAVSAPYANPLDINDAGIVYVYDLNAPQPHLPVLALPNPEPAGSDQFGSALAMSGNRLVIGARLDDALAINSGSVYVYNLTGTSPEIPWLTLRNPTPDIGDFFGRAVAIDGNVLVVGASSDDSSAVDGGTAYLYHLTSGTPTIPVHVLSNPEPAVGDQFGYSVAVSGPTVVIGALTDDHGGSDTGSAYVFDLTLPQPTLPALTLRHPQASPNSQFGVTVGIDGNRIAVGAHMDDLTAQDAGSVHVFDLGSAVPTAPEIALAAPGSGIGDNLGLSIAMAGENIVTGAPSSDLLAWDKGAAYVFGAVITVEQIDITVEQPAGSELFNGISSVSFGNTLVGGTPASLAWQLRSSGVEALQGVSVSIAGPHAADFEVTQVPASSIPAGGNSPMVIRFTPGAGGVRHAQLQITSNDPNENPFLVALSGAGEIPAPEIAIEQPQNNNLTAGFSTVSFGEVMAWAGSTSRTFTLRNAGTANLTGIALTLSGIHASEYSVISPPAATVPPGGFTTFSLLFSPQAAGPRQARVSVASSDADENPFDILLSGAGTVYPDLRVEHPVSNPLANGSAHIDFGQAEVAGDPVDRVFTVRNNGTGVLSALGVSLTGANAGDYYVAVPPPSSIEPGDSSTFTIRFMPLAGGTRQATAQLASNDPDEGLFNIALNGSAQAFPNLSVEQPAGHPLFHAQSSVDFGNAIFGGSLAEITFTLRNNGTDLLSGITPLIAGAGASHFALAGSPATTLLPGQTTTLVVRFQPTVTGDHFALLRVASNDPDDNPFEVEMTGFAMALPQIVIEQPAGAALPEHAARVDFGPVSIGQSGAERVFTLRNAGSGELSGINLQLESSQNGAFRVASFPAGNLEPGQETTFIIRFSPNLAGPHEGMLRVFSNDEARSPFGIELLGIGDTVPDITVEQPQGNSLLAGATVVNFGDTEIGDAADRVFTLRNDGHSDLTGITLALIGVHAADYSVVTPPPASLAVGASASFVLRFSPSADGTRIATTRITSNDPDENPFDIPLSGKALALPNLVVQQPAGSTLTHGVSVVDFASANVGASVSDLTFTLRNDGTGGLNGLQAAISGGQASEFSVVTAPSTNLQPGQSTAMVIRFNPTASGTRQTTLNIASNDPVKNPFVLTLTGQGVVTPHLVIENPPATPLASGSASFDLGSTQLNGTPLTTHFTLRNAGTGVLSGINVSFVGDHAGDFNLASASPATINPGQSSVLTVRFIPQAAGLRSTLMHVASNDPNANPFVIQLSGTGVATPDIVLEQPAGSNLSSGLSFVSFGSAATQASSFDRVFTLRNDGTAPLLDLAAHLSGDHAADFQILSPPPATLAPAASATFTVRFAPQNGGDRACVLSVASNDPDEAPFTVNLTGFGVVTPNIAVELPPGEVLQSGQGAANFGTVVLATTPAEHIFTLRNSGTGPLTLSGLILTGSNASDFTLAQPLPSTLAAGATTTFTLRFAPSSAGPRNATARIFSDDPDTNPFVILLTGQGLPLPDITIEQPAGQSLVNDEAAVTFGTVVLNTSPAVRSFVLRNSGTATLSNLSVAVNGAHAAHFSISSFRDIPLAPGEHFTFNIHFQPSFDGTHAASLVVGSNDSDENPFTIALSGHGLALPDLLVEQPAETEVVSGSPLDFGAVFVGAPASLIDITVRNTGTDVLNILNLSFTGKHPADFSVLAPPANSVPPGESTQFTLRFSPSLTGARTALFSLVTNDPDESPFTLHLAGQSRDDLTEEFTLASPNDTAGATYTFRPPVGVSPSVSSDPTLVETPPSGMHNDEFPDSYATAAVLDQRQVSDPLDPERLVLERLVATSLKYGLLHVRDQFEVRGGKSKRVSQNASAAAHVAVKPKPGVTESQLLAAISLPGASILKTMPLSNLWLVAFQSTSLDSQPAAIAALTATNLVEYVEADLVVRAAEYYPPVPGFSQQWALHNTGQEGGKPGIDIGAPEAWDKVAFGSESPPVAVLDTGVSTGHSAFGSGWSNPAEIPDNFIDDDGNGYIDDVHGWNFVSENANVSDDNGHGTHSAGIIGASGTGQSGGAGLYWPVRFMPLKILDSTGAGFMSDATEALHFASAHGARVSCAAWGAYGFSFALQEAIEQADSAGCLVVTAAGNDGIDIDRHPFFPAASNTENVITAAAINRHGQLSWFSNHGAYAVHLGAPGSDILGASPTGHETFSGTSAAAAHVAGVCVMQMVAYPEMTHTEVRTALLAGVSPLPSLKNKTSSGGLLKASRAVQGPASFYFVPTHPIEITGPPGGPFAPSSAAFQLSNPSGSPRAFTLQSDQPWIILSNRNGTLASGESLEITATLGASAALLPPGRHTARISLTNETGHPAWERQVTLVVQGGYFLTRDSAASFAVDPTGGTPLPLADDAFAEIILADGATIPFFGQNYRSIFVGSNGYITFGAGDWASGGGLERHFDLPRLSALFADLDPAAGGAVSWRQLPGRLVITFENVPEHGGSALNSFQFQLFFDGSLAITILNAGTSEGIIGLSDGRGLPDGFMSSNFSAYPETGQGLPIFTSHPASGSVFAGQAVQLSATAASGGPLAYQWYFNNQPITGADGPELVINAAQTSQAGIYHLSASNAYGQTSSQPATLTVSKRAATIQLLDLAQTYNGSPRAASAETNPPDLSVVFHYNGSSDPPIEADSYAVTAVIDDPVYEGSTESVLVVAQAPQIIDFPVIADQLAPNTVNLSATGGGSGNAITFSVVSGPALINNGTQLSFTGAGEVNISAAQAGNTNFQPATTVTRTFNVSKAQAQILLGALDHTYNGSPRSATATTTPAGLAVNLTYNGAGATPVNAGSYTVAAQLANHPLYTGAASGTLLISKAAQQINFPFISTQTATATLNLSATGGGSGLPVTFAVTSGPAVIAGGTELSFNGSGSVTITANQPGGDNHLPAPPVSRTFNVTKAAASIALSGLNQTYDGTPRPVAATTEPSGLDVTIFYGSSQTPRVNAGTYLVNAGISHPMYTGNATGFLVVAKAAQTIVFSPELSQFATAAVPLNAQGGGSSSPVEYAVVSGPGAIDGGLLRFTGTGQVTVTVSQAGDANHLDAAPVTRVFNVSKAAAAIQLSGLSQTYDGTSRPVAATTAPAGLTVHLLYDSSPQAPVNAGTYAVTATIDDALSQGSTEAVLTVNKAAQSIDFAAIPNQSSSNTLTLTATGGGSGNAVTFAVSSGPAVLNAGNQLSFSSTGEVIITASQAGNANYEPAADVMRSFTISETSAEVFLSGLEQTYDGSPKIVSASTNPPELEVALTYNGSATPPSQAGTYVVQAAITSNPNYHGSATGVLIVNKATQALDFPAPAGQLASAVLPLAAAGGASGNAVVFAVASGPAMITNDNLLSFTGAGVVEITASQAGDDNHLPAPDVTRSLAVSKAPATIALQGLLQAPDGTPCTVTASTTPSGLPVRLTYNGNETAPSEPGRYAVNAVIEHALYEGSATASLMLDHRADREIQTPEDEAETEETEDAVVWSDAAIGLYDGLLRDDSDGHALLGAIERLTVSPPKAGASGGAVSGKLRLNGRGITLRGAFDSSGLFALNLPQETGGSIDVHLRLQQTPSGDELIGGTVAWGGVVARARLPRAPFHASLSPAPTAWTGRYNVLVPSQLDWPANAPVGDGWASATISAAGSIKVAGRLGDGTAFTESAHLSSCGEFALFAEIYRSAPVKGRLGGSMFLRDVPDVSDCDGVLQWSKLADAKEKIHAGGFAVESHAVGSRHVMPSPGTRLLTELVDAEPNASLSLYGPGLTTLAGNEIERALSWLGNNNLRHYGPEKISGKAAAATGLLKGSYRNPATGLKFSFTGITFEKQGLAAGHFVAGGSSGVMRILPGTGFPFPGSEDAGEKTLLDAPDSPASPLAWNEIAFDATAAGAYFGVLTSDGHATGGLENFLVTASGSFSGMLWFEDARFALKGTLDANGTAIVSLPVEGMTLALKLRRSENNADAYQIEGTLSVSGIDHQLAAQSRPAYSSFVRAPQEGAHTLVMLAPEVPDTAVAAAGDGYGALKVSHLGVCTGAMVLPDGAKTTFSGHISRLGEWSLHRGLYGAKPRGWLAGKVTFRSVPGVSDLDGEWTWHKLAGATASARAHTVVRPVVGSRYLAPAKGQRAWSILADTWHNAWWRIDGLDRVVTWTPANKIQYFGPDKLTMLFNSRTGVVGGTYQAPGIKHRFGGVLIQKQGLVSGCQLLPDGSSPFGMKSR